MKNSTVLLVFGILGLGGVGTYLYLKNKKTPIVGSIADDTLGLPTTNSTNTQAPTVADSSLGLNPIIKTTSIVSDSGVIKTVVKDPTTGITKTITTDLKDGTEVTTFVKSEPTTVTVRTITEEEKNRLEASQLASKIRTLDILPSFIKPYNAGTLIAQYSKQINALGYKLLPNFDIEKM